MGCKSCLTSDIEEINYSKSINGLFRFYNKGGECYINSFLNILLHKDLFLNIINSLDMNYDNMKLITELIQLINNSKIEGMILDAKNIKDIMISINNEAYNGNGGNLKDLILDFVNEISSELPSKDKYHIILPEDQKINNALNKLIKKFYSKNNSVFTEIFYGNNMIESLCQKGHIIDVKFNVFITIDLSIYSFINKDKIYIEEIFNEQYKIKNANKTKYCNLCNEEVTIQEKEFIYNLPKIVIIYFSRNFDDKYYENKIEFTKNIDFKNYLKNVDNNENDTIYHLFGIIQNCNGHYNSIAINNYDNKWYFFNDENEPLLVNQDVNKFNPIALFYSK